MREVNGNTSAQKPASGGSIQIKYAFWNSVTYDSYDIRHRTPIIHDNYLEKLTKNRNFYYNYKHFQRPLDTFDLRDFTSKTFVGVTSRVPSVAGRRTSDVPLSNGSWRSFTWRTYFIPDIVNIILDQ